MHNKLTFPRLVAGVIAGLFLVSLGFSDPVAAGTALVGGLAVAFVLRRRSRGAARGAAIALLAGTTTVAVLAALALPTYQSRPQPLVVNEPRGGSPAAPGERPAPQPSPDSHFTALGFVASDYNDSTAGVDRDAPWLSTLAATGITLAPSPGSIEVHAATDALVRGHLNGAAGLAVVSNFDGTAFNGDRAAAMLASPEARRRFVSALTAEVARRGWDGVVLDLEALPPTVRQNYPKLVQALAQALGQRQTVVAVPASTSQTDSQTSAFDLAALGRAAGQVVWMAYDQHAHASAAGPVAGLTWVRETLAVAEAAIPREKLLLGIPGYGYAWSGPARAEDLTAAQAQAEAARPGASSRWDATEAEWQVHTADGRELWFEDARSFDIRARLALDQGLGGIALWRVGAEDPGALTHLPTSPVKHPATARGRPVEPVQATGLVALTFDDGPDPSWTPRILNVLHDKHVPATFFLIGTEAQKYPALVRDEIRNGHVVGNHTYSHQNLPNLPTWRATAEILGGEAVIEGITGKKPSLFRPPYGASDRKGKGAGADQIAAQLHQHVIDWNDNPDDWQRPGVATITQRVLDGATERTVVLLHDGGGDRHQTLAALPGIIDGLRARGYLFTTVDGLDASIRAPYVERRGLSAQAQGLGIIAAYRLMMALRRVSFYLLMAIAGLSILRLVVSVPLALAQARAARRRPPPPGGSVTFTIVVPAHNEARVIAKSLAAISTLGPEVLEVIVVDDGSTDGTGSVAEAFPCRVIRQPQGGKAAALNTAIAAASGDVVVVLDADTVLTPGFLSAIAPHFADPNVGAVAGNVKVGNRRSFLARLQALEYMVSLNVDRRAQSRLNVVSVVPGAAGAFRRRALLDVGGYPSDTLVEDADVTVSLLLAGWRIPYEAGAVAFTEAPESLSAVMRQRRRWSYGTVEVVAKHAGAMLDPTTGRIGLLGLPWTLISQVLLPVGGPLADAFLVYLLVVGNLGMAATMLGLALALDIFMVFGVVLAEREDPRLLLWAPFLRLVWRPLQLFAVFRSVRRWAHGDAELWRQMERYNSVEMPAARGVGRYVPSVPSASEGERHRPAEVQMS